MTIWFYFYLFGTHLFALPIYKHSLQ